jgi:hypothetical protein
VCQIFARATFTTTLAVGSIPVSIGIHATLAPQRSRHLICLLIRHQTLEPAKRRAFMQAPSPESGTESIREASDAVSISWPASFAMGVFILVFLSLAFMVAWDLFAGLAR